MIALVQSSCHVLLFHIQLDRERSAFILQQVVFIEGRLTAFCEEGSTTPYTFESATFDYFSERIH